MSSNKEEFKIPKKPSGSLSASILDYYHTFGQNRDLEKYLRIRRSNSKSSSDGSIQGFSTSKQNKYERLGKSLENLNTLNIYKTKSSEKLHDDKSHSNIFQTKSFEKHAKENIIKPKRTDDQVINEDSKKSKSSDDIHINAKDSQKLNKATKSKSYNFNMESNIEITFKQPNIIETGNNNNQNRKLILETTETQTDIIPVDKKQYPDIPLVKLRKSSETKKRPVSPASSVTSNKGPLEWDALADVGYEQPLEMRESMALTTMERSALKKFFTHHGFYFDENKINLYNPIEDHKGNDKIKTNEPKIVPTDESLITPNKNNLWETALNKYRRKYSKNTNVSELSITDPEIHSTPLPPLPDTSKGAIPKRHTICVGQMEEVKKHHLLEKHCQTSKIEMASKEIQVSDHLGDTNQQSHKSSETSQNDKDLLSPYENYHLNEKYKKNDEEIPLNYDVEENKENVPPENKENVTPTLIENILPVNEDIVDDKEINNLNGSYNERVKDAVQKILESNSYSSKPATSHYEISSTLENDLKIGLDLLNSLVDSSKFDIPTKKQLIRKVVQRLLRIKNLQNQTSSSLSSKSMSTSKSKSITTSAASSSHLQLNLKKKTSHQDDNTSSLSKSISRILISSDSSTDLMKLKQSQTNDISGIKQFSISSDDNFSNKNVTNDIKTTDTEHAILNKDSEQQQQNKNDTIKDWLQPMTHSEIDFEINLLLTERKRRHQEFIKNKQMKQNLLKAQSSVVVEPEKITKDNQNNKNIKVDGSSDGGDNAIIRKFLDIERNSQLNWIEKEIEHLINLKDLLIGEPPNLNEKQSKTSTAAPQSDDLHSSIAYENLNKINKENKKQYNSKEAQTSSCFTNNKNTSINSSIENDKDKQSASKIVKKSSTIINTVNKTIDDDSSPAWNSHLNMQHWFRNRTRLQTPSSNDESFHCFIKSRKNTFLNKYEKTHGKLYTKIDNFNIEPIYTKPYSSSTTNGNGGGSTTDHYSQPNEKFNKIKSRPIMTDAYTSVTGSDMFLSSNSVSIPLLHSTSNTTTHQYDTKASVAVQTSDSLNQLQPIVGASTAPITVLTGGCKQCDCKLNNLICNCGCCCTTTAPTISPAASNICIVARESLAYMITFHDKRKRSLQQNSNEIINHNANSHMETIQTHAKISTKSLPSSHDYNVIDDKNDNNNISDDDQIISLQYHLKNKRPDFLSKANERRKCLKELNNLRQQRNKQRQKLLLLTNNNTIRNSLKLLPPPPLSQKRIFTSKAIRNFTKLQYKNLPEIQQKKEIEKNLKIKKNNRIITDIFNKNLQRHTLKGRTDLSNSFNVVQI